MGVPGCVAQVVPRQPEGLSRVQGQLQAWRALLALSAGWSLGQSGCWGPLATREHTGVDGAVSVSRWPELTARCAQSPRPGAAL